MATYPGMTLGGEVRESISLDEDDLSDVEDEVFIRDGKNSYKVAEELNVKRPLMAPRRKLGKSELLGSRLKSKPPCKIFCKPCCYIFAALILLIGLIVLVVILVSIFPLPLDRLRTWILAKAPVSNTTKLLPCSNLVVTDLWVKNFPTLTTDSPIRTLDINNDGISDIIFGFGTESYNEDYFCFIFLGVAPPCKGGVLAVDGANGAILWRYWTNDTVFDLHCTTDLNGDGNEDCLAIGEQGRMFAIDARNGTIIWYRNNDFMDVFVVNFVPDQNMDNVSDILSAHTSLQDKIGHLLLLCGATGEELKRTKTPNGAETFFMPEIINDYVLFGTGSPSSPGNLSIVKFQDLFKANYTSRVLYQDNYKGVITQPVLTDITGDNIPDVIIAMYNSTILALNGANFTKIWSYTIPKSETNITPTPALFNDDNVTDFLIIYETHDNILNYNYTKTLIIDGKTGSLIYKKPIDGGVSTQMSGLALEMESRGFDMFVFWTSECTNVDFFSKNHDTSRKNTDDLLLDVCRRQFNTSSIFKLNALNQYDQPPGFEIYSSVNRSQEFTNITSPLKRLREYLTKHKIREETFVPPSKTLKFGSSVFRHKENQPEYSENQEQLDDADYEIQPGQGNAMNELPGDYSTDDFLEELSQSSTRDTRSRDDKKQTRKKNLSEKKSGGIYDYQNIKKSQHRLLHDLNNVPWDILRDTYFKNRENQLRKSRFQQRDLTSHMDKIRENEEVKRILTKERKESENNGLNLWDLESEKELQERESYRGKREVNYEGSAIRKITSVGAIVDPLNKTGNAMDLIFITYWQSGYNEGKELFAEDLKDCVLEKRANDQSHTDQKTTEKEQETIYTAECLQEQENLKNQFSFLNSISKMKTGQMTIYRLRIECSCVIKNPGEKCARFLKEKDQRWATYMGRKGDGFFL